MVYIIYYSNTPVVLLLKGRSTTITLRNGKRLILYSLSPSDAYVEDIFKYVLFLNTPY